MLGLTGAVCVLTWFAAGCSLDRRGLGFDASIDSEVDAGCVPAGRERCNGVDDDCNGRVDEGFDLTTDPAHCGSCGRSCPAGPHGTAICTAGACGLACDDGFDDCNGRAADGCEADLAAPTSCGACGVDCTTTATPLCRTDGIGMPHCVATCELPTQLCGDRCVDTSRDVAHCGSCGAACAEPPNARATCTGGTCGFTCRDGFDECDPATLGCESLRSTEHCGACGAACTHAGATSSCDSGTCAFVECLPMFADCDMLAETGCERRIDTPTDCGGCDRLCAPPHALPACTGGTCGIASCDPNRGDCDGDPANGCETDLSLPATCGECTRACGATERCASGVCLAANAVAEIGTGTAFSCARLADGRVYCWGDNASGQLGNGTTTSSSTAVEVRGISDAVDLAVGGMHACVVHAAGSVSCWGENGKRQVGDGTTTDQNVPIANAGGVSDAVQVSAGGEHTCVVRRGGQVACWGRNNVGQLGTAGGDRSTAMDVALGERALQVDCGAAHTCVVLGTREIACWGENGQRQLGDGTTTDRDAPVRASTIDDAVQVSAGADFTCAVRAGGAVWCWGANDQGQLGDGTTTDRGAPALVSMLSGAEQVTCGTDHTCARTTTRRLFCWGSNGNGRLGDGTTDARRTPVEILAAGTVIDASAGAGHTCAARDTGTAICWGSNTKGQIGDGTMTHRDTPTPVAGIPP